MNACIDLSLNEVTIHNLGHSKVCFACKTLLFKVELDTPYIHLETCFLEETE